MSDTPIYAVGDIHGQLEQLEQALALIDADGGPEAEIVFLGDLVDRGASSRAVIQRLLDGQLEGRNWHVIKGNHDRMFTRFVTQGVAGDARILSRLDWLHPRLGGPSTLASYGVETDGLTPAQIHAAAQAAVPARHMEYLQGLDLYLQRGELLFVHAGIAPGVPLLQQTEDDLIWIRDPFLKYSGPHPWLVVHGHTALEMPYHFGNRIDLDGGAGYGRPLLPAVFEGRDCWLLTESGRLQLVP
ncbi:metallophosphoesterase [Sedimentitalea nanhaiensis]|uniref:Serine/threonine protein phosphatase 1 n=1 Tax=Sedimentitalea nanhaiensis TaxID=999627 RepID=A0A1I6X6T4_9RHOB|nr:metallophosphoesterase [Sedimentitalea nanhaiensis]SFT33611.1 serine/threonine protein phosphatase 1 [Sedimentitalea nanhaiensis]